MSLFKKKEKKISKLKYDLVYDILEASAVPLYQRVRKSIDLGLSRVHLQSKQKLFGRNHFAFAVWIWTVSFIVAYTILALSFDNSVMDDVYLRIVVAAFLVKNGIIMFYQ